MTQAMTGSAGQEVGETILEVGGLEAGYGKKEVVYDLSFHLTRGEKLIFLGHNGAGKTTTMAGLFGILKPTSGTVRFEGHDITGRTPAENVRDGIAYVPQGHGIFRRLSVRDNLDLGAFPLEDKSRIPENIKTVFDLFPILEQRQSQIAGTMSGGQQQMLAIGMALMHNPRLIILDEPSIGLAPNLVDRVMQAIRRINEEFGVSIVIVEQNVRAGLSIADRVIVMKTGSKVYDGSPEPLHDHVELMKYF
jgi:branched-chain amino acid transport system ATP-binding protein